VNRTAHTLCSIPSHKAQLVVRLHDQNQTTPIRACCRCGLAISHSLPTEALPSITRENMNKNIEELLTTLDELLDTIDRYHEELKGILEEFNPKTEASDG